MKYSLINYYTFGIRVEPPTNTTSLTSDFDTLASFNTRSTGSIVFLNKSIHKSSNLARVIYVKKSYPSNNDSTSIEAVYELDNVLLALSQAVLNLRNALLFPVISF